jgi:hypothetical protein
MVVEDRTMHVITLVGSGDKIGRATLPFAVAGIVLNVAFPAFFSVGGPPEGLRTLSIVMLVVGLIAWAWSAFLVLTRVPRGELITTGPIGSSGTRSTQRSRCSSFRRSGSCSTRGSAPRSAW